MAGWAAFRGGLARATRYGWLLVLLFVVNLGSGLCLAVLPAASLLDLAQSSAAREAADGVDAWLVIETMMSPLAEQVLAGDAEGLSRGFRHALLLGLLTAGLLPLVAWVPSSFLIGGLLLTYVEAPQSFRWRRFLWGCWHWFGAFLLLGALQGLAALFLFSLLSYLAIALVTVAGGWAAWISIPLLAVCAGLWLAWTELTRVAAVAKGTRNVFRAAGAAAGVLFRRLGAVALLYGAALALLLALHALFRLGLLPLVPLEIWPLAFVVQQAFIVTRLWARLVRLGGGATLWVS